MIISIIKKKKNDFFGLTRVFLSAIVTETINVQSGYKCEKKIVNIEYNMLLFVLFDLNVIIVFNFTFF